MSWKVILLCFEVIKFVIVPEVPICVWKFKCFCNVLTGNWILVEVLHIAKICASETGFLCPAVST